MNLKDSSDLGTVLLHENTVKNKMDSRFPDYDRLTFDKDHISKQDY